MYISVGNTTVYVNDARYEMFCAKNGEVELHQLPPLPGIPSETHPACKLPSKLVKHNCFNVIFEFLFVVENQLRMVSNTVLDQSCSYMETKSGG